VTKMKTNNLIINGDSTRRYALLKKTAGAIVMGVCLATSVFATTKTNDNGFSPAQVNQLHQIIREYLIQNPEVLIEASKALQEKQQAETEKEALQGIEQNKQALFQDPNSPTIGNPDGSVILVEFFDYQCGHCKEMAEVIEELVKKNPNLKVVYKELPIFGGASRIAASASLAAAKQDKYLAFHNALLMQTKALNENSIMAVAKTVGLDTAQLKKDMQSKVIEKQLQDTFNLAQAIKLVGTPTFVLSNKAMTKFEFVPGATSAEDLQQQIDNLKASDTPGQQ